MSNKRSKYIPANIHDDASGTSSQRPAIPLDNFHAPVDMNASHGQTWSQYRTSSPHSSIQQGPSRLPQAHYAQGSSNFDTSDAQAAALAALNSAGTIDPLSLQRFVGRETFTSSIPSSPPPSASVPMQSVQSLQSMQAKQEEAPLFSAQDVHCANEALALLVPSVETLAAYSNLPSYQLNKPPLGSVREEEEDDGAGPSGSNSRKRTSTRKRGRPPRTLPPSPPPTAAQISFPDLPRAEDGEAMPQAVPAAYIREHVDILKESWMIRALATHNLFIRALPQSGQAEDDEVRVPDTRLYPIHEMVLVSQLAYWQLLCKFGPAREEGWKPVAEISVPQPDYIDPVMYWLHHHDETTLATMLDEVVDGEDGWLGLVWFARNVRSLGVCDDRIRSVVQSWAQRRLGFVQRNQ